MPPLSTLNSIEDVTSQIVADLTTFFGGVYSVSEREPLDTEISPFQCWVSTTSFMDDVRYGDTGKNLQLKAEIYVTTVFEFSRSTDHYRATRHLRKEILKSLHRSVILPIGDALIVIGNEETFLEESYFMSSYPITVSWSEGVEASV